MWGYPNNNNNNNNNNKYNRRPPDTEVKTGKKNSSFRPTTTNLQSNNRP